MVFLLLCDPITANESNLFFFFISRHPATRMKLTKAAVRLSLSLLLLSPFLYALEFPQGFSLETNGVIRLGNQAINLKNADLGWSGHENTDWENLQTERTDTGFRVTGTASYPGYDFRIEGRIQQTGENTYHYEGAFHFPHPVQMNALFAEIRITLPLEKLTLDGQEVKVPALQGHPELVATRKVRTISVKSWGGTAFTVTGDLRLMVQDNRKWGNQTLSIRIFTHTPPLEPLTWKDAEVKFDLKVDSPSARPVALGAAANRSLSDEDGTGWLGKGAEADLKSLSAGTLSLAQFPFEIAPERKAIVLGRTFSKEAVTLTLPADTRARAVTLLHAADWPLLAGWQPEKEKPIGFIDVAYADGKTESIPVRTEIDCSHWQTIGLPFPNAVPGYIGEAEEAAAGLYASSFALAQDNPVSLSFRPAFPENTAWMIAAVTLSSRAVAFPPSVKRAAFTLRANAHWRPISFSGKTVPGSPLDFSTLGLQDVPAGKYGAVCVNDEGEFTFENAPEPTPADASGRAADEGADGFAHFRQRAGPLDAAQTRVARLKGGMQIAPEFFEAAHQRGGSEQFGFVPGFQRPREGGHAFAESCIAAGGGRRPRRRGGDDFLRQGRIPAQPAPEHQPLHRWEALQEAQRIVRRENVAVVDDRRPESGENPREGIEVDHAVVHLHAGPRVDNDGPERIPVDERNPRRQRFRGGVAEPDFDGKAVRQFRTPRLEHPLEGVRIFRKPRTAPLFGDKFPGAPAIEVDVRVAEVAQRTDHVAQRGGIFADDLRDGRNGAVVFRKEIGEKGGLDAPRRPERDERRQRPVHAAELLTDRAAEIAERDAAERSEAQRRTRRGRRHGRQLRTVDSIPFDHRYFFFFPAETRRGGGQG